MGLDRTRAYLLSLPFVEETLQWDILVYWVLDKAVGGKMFAMLPPDMNRPHVAGFAARPALYNDLLEIEGVRPAPYLAHAVDRGTAVRCLLRTRSARTSSRRV